ncbi:hypothetical protein Pmani_005307 [Petrolisthes manimaculis]|uniref:Uncharacterized protein n=1 Tax=Petrolisthes manimaculis TaxID=1843537 RepID=A0AAE1UN21_9EUCA|nr:hypothetical protein Pmani_005307 [Petrolisthes manimaculis]
MMVTADMTVEGVWSLVTRREFNAPQIHIVGRIRIELFTLSPSCILVAGKVVLIGGGMLPVVMACSQ